METKMDMVKHRLYDADSLFASEVKLYPGTSRDLTPERMAEQINNVIAQLENGEYDLVDEDCD